jgi:hypothetical protein
VPDIRTISFISKSGGVWGNLRHVVSDEDGAYSTVLGFANTALQNNLLAIAVEATTGDAIDILDISNCGPFGPGTCLAGGEAVVLHSGIPGGGPSFLGNSLLHATGQNHFNYSRTDLLTLISVPFLSGHGVDSRE